MFNGVGIASGDLQVLAWKGVWGADLLEEVRGDLIHHQYESERKNVKTSTECGVLGTLIVLLRVYRLHRTPVALFPRVTKSIQDNPRLLQLFWARRLDNPPIDSSATHKRHVRI